MAIKGITRVAKGEQSPVQNKKRNAKKRDLANRYEIVIRQPDVVAELRMLDIGNKDLNGSRQNLLILSDRALLYEPVDKTSVVKSMTGACHGLNQVFVAGNMPFYSRVDTDRTVKIGRISDKFNPAKYASVEGHRLTGKNDTTHYEEPKGNQADRMKDWLRLTNINYEAKPATEDEARKELVDIAQPIKDMDRAAYAVAERSYFERYTDDGEPIKLKQSIPVVVSEIAPVVSDSVSESMEVELAESAEAEPNEAEIEPVEHSITTAVRTKAESTG